jgi:glycerol transport system ATP-binding protein
MSSIVLKSLRHSYLANPQTEEDYALRKINLTWKDGGAFALLGPSGCGKTTLLNLISGLLKPTEGQILFDDSDVTALPPDQRNIAQVFQFPVVYDTMSVYANLAFPLRNRKLPETKLDERVKRVARMLSMQNQLKQRASGLTAADKQKISLGRGLVRSDVNVMMFDEPLTVIDPHLKWELRSQLIRLHQQVGFTMIYVTHDQTEALTFADEVVVMYEGQIVQIGTPEELFAKPQHTFVGHFIGSPGMNLLPCEWLDEGAVFAGHRIQLNKILPEPSSTANLQLGIRPEFIRLASEGIPARIQRVDDVGRYRIIKAEVGGWTLNIYAGEEVEIPSDSICLNFDPEHTHVYCDGWIHEAKGQS